MSNQSLFIFLITIIKLVLSKWTIKTKQDLQNEYNFFEISKGKYYKGVISSQNLEGLFNESNDYLNDIDESEFPPSVLDIFKDSINDAENIL